MTTLLLVRHGESIANANGIFIGHTDLDLSPIGYIQAKQTAKFIKENYGVDKVYASDLKRAFNTGKCTADVFGLKIIADKGLREIYAGTWEGEKYTQLLKTNADYQKWKKDIGSTHPTKGESVAEIWERIHKKIREIAESNYGKTVVIATHAVPIRCMMTSSMGMSLDEMKAVPWVANASVTEILYENKRFTIKKGPMDDHLDIKSV